MQVVIISGRSGSGKSTALQVLEDCEYYCVDNLPVGLLSELVERIQSDNESDIDKIAIGVDARNVRKDLASVPAILEKFKQQQIDLNLIFLDANDNVLIKRFSSTRRKHPLSSENRSLTESIADEKELLMPIADYADLSINTSELTIHELRERIKQHLSHLDDNATEVTLIVQSFGFKHGVPADADFVFDVRCLPNPFWEPSLRALTGLDPAIQQFLESSDTVETMRQDIFDFIQKWLPEFEKNDRSYLNIAIGCTGGQHRSVYVSSWLHKNFAEQKRQVQIKHRELSDNI